MTKYAYVELPDVNYTAIMISEGIFNGVIYHYGNVQFKEDKESDEVTLGFDYVIDRNLGDVIQLGPDGNERDFVDIIGPILKELIGKSIEEQRLTFANESNGTNNSTIITDK